MGATEAEQLRHAPLLGEAAHGLAPLCGALDVADALARIDHVTADRAGEVQPGQLAGHRGGRRLIELAHPFVDLARRDPGKAGQRERQHLQIHHPEAAADLQRLRRVLGRSRRVAVRDQRDLALQEREPAVLLAVVAVREQPVRVTEPALRDGVVAAEHDRVVRQPRRRARSRARIAAAAIGAERSRPCLQARVALAQEARGVRPALQRLGLLAVRQRALEVGLGVVPCAAGQRLVSRPEVPQRDVVELGAGDRAAPAARAPDPG